MSEVPQIYYLQLTAEEFNEKPYKAGTIWSTSKPDLGSHEILLFFCNNATVKSDDILVLPRDFLTDVSRFGKIGFNEFQLLIPVSVDKRLEIYRDPDWLSEGLAMKPGSRVVVTQPERMTGVVRFVGFVRDGTMFGVELDPKYHGKGTSNGTFKKTKYFDCEEDCAVFYNLYRLHLENRASFSQSRSVSETKSPVENVLDFRDASFEDQGTSLKIVSERASYPLSIDERVVWMSDEGPEFGTVKWIGRLPDATTDETTVGVEFDHPIGSGTGRYKSHRLFMAERNHASLVPILGLMKMSDYMPEAAESVSGSWSASSPGRNSVSTQNQGYRNPGRPDFRTSNVEHMSQEFEKLDFRTRQSSAIRGRVMPPSITSDAVESLCGKDRGLQGQSGACGLESVIYALFAFSSGLDQMLYKESSSYGDELVVAVKNILVEHIVNPLRAINYVSSDRIFRYKELASMIGQPDVCNVGGMAETDDIESSGGKQDDPGIAVRQIFSSILDVTDHVLKIENFDRSSSIESLQCALDRNKHSWQQTAPFSVLAIEVKRAEQPASTSGIIYPDPIIDLSGIVEGYQMNCKICGKDADLQCTECIPSINTNVTHQNNLAFCYTCFDMYHQRSDRRNHRPKKLHHGVYAPEIFTKSSAKMEIFAVVSMIRGHFVSFVRSGSGIDSPWLFYDGMANRAIVDGRGVFIPEVRRCEVGKCLVGFEKFVATPFGKYSDLVQNMIKGLRLCFYRPLHS